MKTLEPARNTATSSKMGLHFPSGIKLLQINLDGWPKVLDAGLKVPTQSSLFLVMQFTKEKYKESYHLWKFCGTSIQTKLKHNESASLWVAT
jgi:hypothetical protein